MRIYTALFLVLCFLRALPQGLHEDSLRHSFRADSAKIFHERAVRPFMGLHQRNSIGLRQPANLVGFQLGAILINRHIVGWARYFSMPVTTRMHRFYAPDLQRTVKFDYNAVYYKFILYTGPRFEFHIPLELGYGRNRISYFSNSGEFLLAARTDFFISSYGLQCIYKPIRWGGITAHFGYRGSSEELLTGFYYAGGIWLNYREIESFARFGILRKKYKRLSARNHGETF